jgi:hypothetical protein
MLELQLLSWQLLFFASFIRVRPCELRRTSEMALGPQVQDLSLSKPIIPIFSFRSDYTTQSPKNQAFADFDNTEIEL